MLMNLKLLRVANNLSQEQFAKTIGVNRATYSSIERGVRQPPRGFWNKVQQAFGIPDADMWQLQKDNVEGNECGEKSL